VAVAKRARPKEASLCQRECLRSEWVLNSDGSVSDAGDGADTGSHTHTNAQAKGIQTDSSEVGGGAACIDSSGAPQGHGLGNPTETSTPVQHGGTSAKPTLHLQNKLPEELEFGTGNESETETETGNSDEKKRRSSRKRSLSDADVDVKITPTNGSTGRSGGIGFGVGVGEDSGDSTCSGCESKLRNGTNVNTSTSNEHGVCAGQQHKKVSGSICT